MGPSLWSSPLRSVASDDCPQKSATVDMNPAALQYFSQITRDLSPEQFHRLLNIIKEIVAVMR